MKHRFILFISLTVLLASGFLYALIEAETGSTRLVILPENVTGDPKAAEGLVVSFDLFTEIGERNPYGDRNPAAEIDTGVYRSEVTYGADGPALRYEIIPGNWDYRVEQEHYLDQYDLYEFTRLGAYGPYSGYSFGRGSEWYVYDLLHGTLRTEWEKAGKPKTLVLSDYMEYYSMVEDVYPPGWDFGVGYSTHGYLSMIGQDSTQEESAFSLHAATALRELKEFFRIPVLTGDQWIMKDNIFYPEPVGTEHFVPRFINTNNDRNLFVTFCALAENGQPVDTSQIPGGYGIYILPYVSIEENGGGLSYIQPEGLRLFSPLDTDIEVRKLGMSLDGKTLYVVYIRDGEYFARIIDAETAEVYADVSLGRDNRLYDSDFNESVFPFEEYVAVWNHSGRSEDDRLFVLGRNADGRMGILMETPYNDAYYPMALAFDGEKLATAYTDYYTVQVAVFSEEGLLYHGSFEHSMWFELIDSTYIGSMERLNIRWSR